MKKRISIIICTHNRAGILIECLQSLLQQTEDISKCEVLIIDNNSSDNTPSVVNRFTSIFPDFKYYFENEQGLSNARNTACEKALCDWIIYIDDDAKLLSNYIERAFWIIDNYDFDCFGGLYTAWYLYGKPQWLPIDFGNKKLLRADIGLIDGSTGWLSGGNFAIKKTVLEAVGGFNPELGMTGNKIGYGEEDYLQQKLFEQGYKIGFDPDLIIEHAVMPHKLKLLWHLKSSFTQGVVKEQIRSKRRNITTLIYELLKTLAGLFVKRLPKGIWRLFVKKEYCWQNLVLDSFSPIYRSVGSLYYKISFKKTNS